MKAPFPRFRIRELSHLQMQTTISRLVKEVKPVVKSDITMNLQVTTLENQQAQHEKLLARVSGSDLTVNVHSADEERDRGTKLFISKVKTLLDDFEEHVSADAHSIYVPIEKQGGMKLIRKPFAEQSAGTNIIVNELSTPEMKTKLERLALIKDFERMANLNKAFEDLWKQRIEESSNTETLPEMKETRLALENTLRGLISNIEFLYLADHPMITETLYNTIRSLIVEMESTISTRKTADEKVKAAESSAPSAS